GTGDVAESADPGSDAVGVDEGGDECLAGDFAGGIKGDRKKRTVILGSRKHGRLSVNRAAAREDQILGLRHPHPLQDVVGHQRSALEVEIGVTGSELDIAVGGQMPDQIGTQALKKSDHPIAVEKIELMELKIRMADRAGQVLAPAEEIVVDAVNLVAAFQQSREKIGGDEAGRAGDHHSHASALLTRARSSGV